jgi:lipoprotein signal peptidase
MRHFKLRIRVIVFTGLDLLSKYVFYNFKYLNETTLILPVLNKWISRSLPVPYLIIMGVSILGIGAFIRLFAKRKINRIIASLLIAGTIGNWIDRIIYGGVRDFINVNIFNFPIFNLADTMLCIGVGIRILIVMLEKKK